jgi:hypothetical protein
MVKHIVAIDKFSKIVDDAVAAASFLSRSTAKWRPQVMNVLEQVYGSRGVLSLASLTDTRWNSLQAVMATQLRVKTGLEDFVRYKKNTTGFPKSLLVWRPSVPGETNTFFCRT